MKKIFLSIIALVFVFVATAQTIEKVEGYYYLVSPNAMYYAGSQQGATAYRYDLAAKVENSIDPEGDFGFKPNAISNDGVVAGSYGWKAALWVEGNEYELLPLPEDLSALDLETNDAVAISPDGKQIVVAFNANGGPKTYYVYTKTDEGLYDMVKLPMPEKDPIYGMYSQWIGVKDMSLDGNVLVGFFVADDGMRQLPLIWRKNGEGVWSYEFFGLDICLKEGKTIPPYPYESVVENPETGELEMPYLVWEEWETAKAEAESGYYYQMTGMMVSGNAKYISFNIAKQLEGEEYATIYAAAYDLDKDELVIFENMQNATSLSVNDNGEVIIGTPRMESFRWSYVCSINKPNARQTLTEWVNNRTNGGINLAEYMTYPFDEMGQDSVVAEGTAYWAKEGDGFVTYIDNVFGTGAFESFFVTFGAKSADRPVYNDSRVSIYPNPTSGILNVSKTMTNVEVYDVIGRKVYTCSVVENSIDLTELHAGQYFLVGEVEGQRVSTKLMIKK